MNETRRPMKKEGRILAVVRPDDPKAALEEARRIMREEADGALTHEEAEKQFNAILTSQPYRYVGIACADLPKRGELPLVLNHDFTVIEGDGMRSGDSFVPYDSLNTKPISYDTID